MITAIANTRLEAQEYRVSLERLDDLNRSAIPLLLARMTAACPSHGKSSADVASAADLVSEIRAHCAADSDFIRASMPLQEILFRTLLLAKDQTLTLGELHRELTERWSSPIRPITVTVTGLARILDSDGFYGFDAVPTPEPELADSGLPMLNPSDDDPLLAEAFNALLEDEEDEYEEDDEDLYEEDEDEEER